MPFLNLMTLRLLLLVSLPVIYLSLTGLLIQLSLGTGSIVMNIEIMMIQIMIVFVSPKLTTSIVGLFYVRLLVFLKLRASFRKVIQ